MAESFTFTQRRVEQAPVPETGRIEYADSVQPKLRLRVTATGHRSFILLHKDLGGTVRRLTLGSFPAMGVVAARKAAAKALAEYLDGGDPMEAKRKAKVEALTLGQLLDRYIESRSLKESTKADYRKRLELGFEDWSNRPASKITEAMILRRHKALTTRGPTLANGCFRVLRATLRYGVAVGALEADPVAVLSKARMWHPPKRCSRIIASEDLGGWVRAVAALPSVKDRALLHLLLFSGLRVGEAVGLRWADVDLAKKLLTARDTKNHRDHELPLAEALLPHLRALRGETGGTPYLFTEDGAKPWGHPRYAIERAVKATGIEFAAHDLQRTFATIGEAVGLSTTLIKRLLNHVTDNEVTSGYIRTETDTLRVAVNKIASFIQARVDGGEVVHLADFRREIAQAKGEASR